MVAVAMLVRRSVRIRACLLAAPVATKERSEIDVTGALQMIALLSVHIPP
jgi:hypothetical protein